MAFTKMLKVLLLLICVCTHTRGGSLFDDVDFTIDYHDDPRTDTHVPSPEPLEEEGDSLFGGPKMSHSIKELSDEKVPIDDQSKEINFVPESSLLLEHPRRADTFSAKPRTASAAVSTSIARHRKGSSLFDEVPNAGAVMPEDKIRERRLSLGLIDDFGSDSSEGYGQHTSLFDLVSLYPLDDELSSPLDYSFQNSFGAHRFSPQLQDESEETIDGLSTSQTLQLLAQSAQQLAKALGSKPKFQHLSGTYPHSIQGDIQAALEKLTGHGSSISNNDPESSREYRKASIFTQDDLSELVKLFSDSRETTSLKDDSMDEESLSEIRRRRLEDLRLAVEIVKAFNTPSKSSSRRNEEDESFMLTLAKSIYSRSVNSLNDLNVKQRDTLHSLMDLVKEAQLQSPNSNLIPPTSIGPQRSPNVNYLPPSNDPPTPIGPPRSPDVNYLPPNNNPPLTLQNVPQTPVISLPQSNNPPSPSINVAQTPSISVISANTYRLPLTYKAIHTVIPQQNLSPTANPISLPAAPAQSGVYGLPQSPPVQNDPLPPAPPPSPPPPPPPPPTTLRTTPRPINTYLPPSDDVRTPQPLYQVPSLSLPLASIEDEDSFEFLPVSNPSNPGYHSNTPSDTTLTGFQNGSIGSVHYVHYHYHIAGSQDELFNQSTTRAPARDDSSNCGPGKLCNRQPFSPSFTFQEESSYSSLGDEIIVGRPALQLQEEIPSLNTGYRLPVTTPPPFNPVTPSLGYGPPRTTPPPLNPVTPSLGYGPPRPTPPRVPLPATYGPPPTPPRIPAVPTPMYGYGPPPTTTPPPRLPPSTPPPAPPAVYGPPLPTLPNNPAPPAPPPTTPPPLPPPPAPTPNVFLLRFPQPTKAPSKDLFSFFKKSKPKKPSRQRAVLAYGPYPVGNQRLPAAQPQRDVQRNPIQDQTNTLELQLMLNEQRLRQQQRQLDDLNRMRLQIRVQELQREQLKDNLFKTLKKDKSNGDIKKMFYKGAMLLGAMALLPIAVGRKRRDVSQYSAYSNYTSSDSPVFEMATSQSVPLFLGNILEQIEMEGVDSVKEDADNGEKLLPPEEAMAYPSCLSLSFCKLMLHLEGTDYHHTFLEQYELMFKDIQKGPLVTQVLTDAQRREDHHSRERHETCDAYACPLPEDLL